MFRGESRESHTQLISFFAAAHSVVNGEKCWKEFSSF